MRNLGDWRRQFTFADDPHGRLRASTLLQYIQMRLTVRGIDDPLVADAIGLVLYHLEYDDNHRNFIDNWTDLGHRMEGPSF